MSTHATGDEPRWSYGGLQSPGLGLERESKARFRFPHWTTSQCHRRSPGPFWLNSSRAKFKGKLHAGPTGFVRDQPTSLSRLWPGPSGVRSGLVPSSALEANIQAEAALERPGRSCLLQVRLKLPACFTPRAPATGSAGGPGESARLCPRTGTSRPGMGIHAPLQDAPPSPSPIRRGSGVLPIPIPDLPGTGMDPFPRFKSGIPRPAFWKAAVSNRDASSGSAANLPEIASESDTNWSLVLLRFQTHCRSHPADERIERAPHSRARGRVQRGHVAERVRPDAAQCRNACPARLQAERARVVVPILPDRRAVERVQPRRLRKEGLGRDERRCGSGEPSPMGGVSPVPMQRWAGGAQSVLVQMCEV